MLRFHGSRDKVTYEEVGYNSRLDELQAALLRVKLPALEADNAHRAVVAQQYLEGLQGLQHMGLRLPPTQDPDFSSAWHLFVVRHPQRDRLAALLAAAGIGTVIHYPVPPHLQPAYAGTSRGAGSLPISEGLHKEVLSLPIGPTQSRQQTAQVISVLRSACRACLPTREAADTLRLS